MEFVSRQGGFYRIQYWLTWVAIAIGAVLSVAVWFVEDLALGGCLGAMGVVVVFMLYSYAIGRRLERYDADTQP